MLFIMNFIKYILFNAVLFIMFSVPVHALAPVSAFSDHLVLLQQSIDRLKQQEQELHDSQRYFVPGSADHLNYEEDLNKVTSLRLVLEAEWLFQHNNYPEALQSFLSGLELNPDIIDQFQGSAKLLKLILEHTFEETESFDFFFSRLFELFLSWSHPTYQRNNSVLPIEPLGPDGEAITGPIHLFASGDIPFLTEQEVQELQDPETDESRRDFLFEKSREAMDQFFDRTAQAIHFRPLSPRTYSMQPSLSINLIQDNLTTYMKFLNKVLSLFRQAGSDSDVFKAFVFGLIRQFTRPTLVTHHSDLYQQLPRLFPCLKSRQAVDQFIAYFTSHPFDFSAVVTYLNQTYRLSPALSLRANRESLKQLAVLWQLFLEKVVIPEQLTIEFKQLSLSEDDMALYNTYLHLTHRPLTHIPLTKLPQHFLDEAPLVAALSNQIKNCSTPLQVLIQNLALGEHLPGQLTPSLSETCLPQLTANLFALLDPTDYSSLWFETAHGKGSQLTTYSLEPYSAHVLLAVFLVRDILYESLCSLYPAVGTLEANRSRNLFKSFAQDIQGVLHQIQQSIRLVAPAWATVFDKQVIPMLVRYLDDPQMQSLESFLVQSPEHVYQKMALHFSNYLQHPLWADPGESNSAWDQLRIFLKHLNFNETPFFHWSLSRHSRVDSPRTPRLASTMSVRQSPMGLTQDLISLFASLNPTLIHQVQFLTMESTLSQIALFPYEDDQLQTVFAIFTLYTALKTYVSYLDQGATDSNDIIWFRTYYKSHIEPFLSSLETALKTEPGLAPWQEALSHAIGVIHHFAQSKHSAVNLDEFIPTCRGLENSCFQAKEAPPLKHILKLSRRRTQSESQYDNADDFYAKIHLRAELSPTLFASPQAALARYFKISTSPYFWRDPDLVKLLKQAIRHLVSLTTLSAKADVFFKDVFNYCATADLSTKFSSSSSDQELYTSSLRMLLTIALKGLSHKNLRSKEEMLQFMNEINFQKSPVLTFLFTSPEIMPVWIQALHQAISTETSAECLTSAIDLWLRLIPFMSPLQQKLIESAIQARIRSNLPTPIARAIQLKLAPMKTGFTPKVPEDPTGTAILSHHAHIKLPNQDLFNSLFSLAFDPAYFKPRSYPTPQELAPLALSHLQAWNISQKLEFNIQPGLQLYVLSDTHRQFNQRHRDVQIHDLAHLDYSDHGPVRVTITQGLFQLIEGPLKNLRFSVLTPFGERKYLSFLEVLLLTELIEAKEGSHQASEHLLPGLFAILKLYEAMLQTHLERADLDLPWSTILEQLSLELSQTPLSFDSPEVKSIIPDASSLNEIAQTLASA